MVKDGEEVEEAATKARVLCAWCGAEMREGDEPGWTGMCQPCFRRMVDERLRLASRSQEYASER
jgi:hypothetical protein